MLIPLMYFRQVTIQVTQIDKTEGSEQTFENGVSALKLSIEKAKPSKKKAGPKAE